ncbi:hypothetical protein AVEN_169962-1 [Araneus ventricosus]|uniref:Uncharacterized protein n=1 Tax=Araneus ventricosus TaxID=182803 RepID=A0A4Y2M0H5_ARAVE|nr:hypothetical protein AVEN_169962-1 [Araneus ventricosus]
MEFCIQQFSSALCLVIGTEQSVDDLHPLYFCLTDHSDDVRDAIQRLREIFDKEFQSIVDNISNQDTLGCFNSFMKATLSRLVKLSVTPSYTSFVLSCALVNTIAAEMFLDLRCFTFAKVTSLCLIAVYNRCYKSMFKEKEESTSLHCFCRRINIQSRDCGGRLATDVQQQISILLESLKDVDYQNFSLTDDEEKMLHDVLRYEDIPEDPEVPTNMLCEFHSSSVDASDIEEAMDCLNLDEHEDNSSEVNQVCQYCDLQCSNFLLWHQREFLEKFNL